MELVGRAEVVAHLMAGSLCHACRKVQLMKGSTPCSHVCFNDIIAWMHPFMHQLLTRQCGHELERMKKIPALELGSFERAITTSDGFWKIPGHFSPNGSAVIANFLSGALLAFDHLCMHGNDKYVVMRVCNCPLNCEPDALECDGKDTLVELWEGTAKAMESSI